MKFQSFFFLKAWDCIYILPTIQIITNDGIFAIKNFTISVHWLGWHFRWRWLEE